MNSIRPSLAILFLSLLYGSIAAGQENKAATPAAAPPNLVLLVHREIQFGKASAGKKLQVTLARSCDRLESLNSWVGLESLSGQRETLFFDPFDSFEQLEQSYAEWAQLYASHPDLARLKEELDALVTSERTIVAVRRDDLGYHTDTIDLSEMRYMRVLEVHLVPGHERDFVEAFKILAEAHEKMKTEIPWVVYQVDLGLPTSAFFILMPMPGLKQNDDLLTIKQTLLEAAGGESVERLEQIAREGYASVESNLYVVSPETSHVSKEFAAGDPDFWRPGASPHVKSSQNEQPQQPHLKGEQGP